MYVADHGVGVRVISKAAVTTLAGPSRYYNEGVLGVAVTANPHMLFITGYSGIVRYDFAAKTFKEIGSPIQQPAGIWPYAVAAISGSQAMISSPNWSTVFFVDFADGVFATNPFVRPLIGQMEQNNEEIPNFADGAPDFARLAIPMGIALDESNDVIVADGPNRRIRTLPAVDTRWAVRDSLTLPEEPSVFRMVLVSNSFRFWNCMWPDSIAGTLERELNAHRAELYASISRLSSMWLE